MINAKEAEQLAKNAEINKKLEKAKLQEELQKEFEESTKQIFEHLSLEVTNLSNQGFKDFDYTLPSNLASNLYGKRHYVVSKLRNLGYKVDEFYDQTVETVVLRISW